MAHLPRRGFGAPMPERIGYLTAFRALVTRHILDEPSDETLYCGLKASRGSFCAGHAQLNYAKGAPRKTNTGAKPGPTSNVTCHYHGTVITGEVFDSSVQRGRPATFPLNRVIAGWTEALQLMALGSKWRLYLPPHLAYGEQQVSAVIGPNSTLIFEVELLGV